MVGIYQPLTCKGILKHQEQSSKDMKHMEGQSEWEIWWPCIFINQLLYSVKSSYKVVRVASHSKIYHIVQ